MYTIDTYIDAALEKQKFPSDRQLALRLGVTCTPLSHWRRKRNWPSDDIMFKLAALAGIDQKQALLDLNQWRATSAGTRNAYAFIAEALRKYREAEAKRLTDAAA